MEGDKNGEIIFPMIIPNENKKSPRKNKICLSTFIN